MLFSRVAVAAVMVLSVDYQIYSGVDMLVHWGTHCQQAREQSSDYGRMAGLFQVILGVANMLIGFDLLMKHKSIISLCMYYLVSTH